VLSDLAALELTQSEDVSVLGHISSELRGLTGSPALTSIVVTYQAVASQKRAALAELNRMLGDSVEYLRANREDVLREVAIVRQVDETLLAQWWSTHDVAFGDGSPATGNALRAVWQAAVGLGDVESFPDVDGVFLDGQAGAGTVTPNIGRTTVSLAVLDDPARRSALYAIERGVVRSGTVDISLTYLPLTALAEAASARQFDAVEVEPLAVPLTSGSRLGLVVLSGGVVDLDGVLLFVAGVAGAP
jgi:hypothetical protein